MDDGNESVLALPDIIHSRVELTSHVLTMVDGVMPRAKPRQSIVACTVRYACQDATTTQRIRGFGPVPVLGVLGVRAHVPAGRPRNTLERDLHGVIPKRDGRHGALSYMHADNLVSSYGSR
jgi:hypothetical protein